MQAKGIIGKRNNSKLLRKQGQCDSVYSSQPDDFCRKYTYDMLGRKTTYIEGHLNESYVYTGTNLTQKTMGWYNSITNQPDSKTLTYTYDHNRLIATQSSEYQQPTNYIEYIYDDQNLQGRLVAIKDESGMQCFEYSNMGEITKSTRAYSLPTQAPHIALSTRFTYDSWGRMQKIIYPDAEVLDYAYDHGGQLKSMSGTKDSTTYNYLDSMLYDKFGAKTQMGYGNQMLTEYYYDSYNLRLMNVIAHKQSTIYFSLDYQYDNKGNITELTSTYDWLPGEIITQEFTYDSTDQLITAMGNTQTDSIYDNAIEYGNWGKIQQYDIEITDPLTSIQTENYTDYTYPASNNNRTQTLFGAEHSHTYQPNGTPPDVDIDYDFGINGSLRRKEADQNSEYYLFNAFNCMKAYSFNGERYGYYGYDASGERTYKYDIFSAGSWTNETGGMNVSLQIDKMMLYPNGYLNMNQNGEYTKHYYADALRIASKIGSGFSQNLCDEMDKILNGVDSSYLDERRDIQYEEMMEELTELIDGNQITSINPIPYPEADLCNLSGSGIETALFFYHPDHLGSTGMVTDNYANVTQGFLYAPFGELIYEHNPGWESSRIPKYAFNAKELDEENGMYYYSARYYAPPTFISRDPMFEKYPSINPYSYCKNNPVGFVDPTGEEWEDIEGNIISEKQQKNIKVYIFYDPNSFKGQTETMYKEAEAKYGKGSVALSSVTTTAEFSKDWADMGGSDIKEVNLNYHGGPQTLNLDAKNNQYITATGTGSTPLGNKALDVSALPNISGNVNGAQLNINSCQSNNTDRVSKGTTLAIAFKMNTSFNTIRTTSQGVSYFKLFSPNAPHPEDHSNWQYLRNSPPPKHFGVGLPPR